LYIREYDDSSRGSDRRGEQFGWAPECRTDKRLARSVNRPSSSRYCGAATRKAAGQACRQDGGASESDESASQCRRGR
jgi:hypothetical protein